MISTGFTMKNGTTVEYLKSKDGQLDYSRVIVKANGETLMLETKMVENQANLSPGSIEMIQQF